jgi:uncharacterized protein YktB (UPF0637 family)
MSVKKHQNQKQGKESKIIEQSLFDDFQKTASNEVKKSKDGLKQGFSTVAELLTKHPIKENNKYISQEFQAFGCHMATILGDQAHTSLYIKLAKTYPRSLLEQALAFVSDAESARSKAKLFMWKLNLLKKAKAKVKKT